MHVLHQEKYGDHLIELVSDDHCDSDPREWCNVGTMVCWHNRYSLGDQEALKNWSEPQEFEEWCKGKGVMILSLYLYDHSGITMSAQPFSCPWDSGQVGYIFVTYENIQKEFGDLTEVSMNKAKEILLGEVNVYDAHIRGNCFGYRVTDPDGNEIDSCWGYHGYQDIDWDYALSEAREMVKHAIESQVGAGI